MRNWRSANEGCLSVIHVTYVTILLSHLILVCSLRPRLRVIPELLSLLKGAISSYACVGPDFLLMVLKTRRMRWSVLHDTSALEPVHTNGNWCNSGVRISRNIDRT